MANEVDYERGSRAAWQQILGVAMRGFGMTGRSVESLVLEREATVVALRSLCETHGDNEWPADLHLADVVEKHLRRYLDDDRENDEEE